MCAAAHYRWLAMSQAFTAALFMVVQQNNTSSAHGGRSKGLFATLEGQPAKSSMLIT
jgi:hypothetical protein